MSPVDIDGFAAGTIRYYVGLAATVAQVTITAVPTNSNAAVTYDPASDDDANADGHQVDLSDGLNTVSCWSPPRTGPSAPDLLRPRGPGRNRRLRLEGRGRHQHPEGRREPVPLRPLVRRRYHVGRRLGRCKLYAYDLETKARVPGKDFDTLDAQNTNPTSLWSDGETMWVADTDFDNGFVNPKLFAYDVDTKARVPGQDFTLHAGNGIPQGIWSDGETMWVTDYAFGDDKLYAYDLETKARVSGRDFDTLNAAGNDFPSGLWSDGVTMWVADFGDDKLYAYDLESKERVPGQDFDTLKAAGNKNPRGLWSDGVTMWVADTSDKLYSYNMPVSDNADLRSITVDGRALAGFDPAETAYSHRVDETATQVTVAAEARQLLAEVTSVTPSDADPSAAGHQVDFPE